MVLAGAVFGLLPTPSPAQADPRVTLATPVSLDKGIDPNTPLKDVLEFLSDRHALSIRIDAKAFKGVAVQEIETQPVKLPRFKDVRLGTVLQLVLEQVNATYRIEKDSLLLIPADPRKLPIERVTSEQVATEKALRGKLKRKITLQKGIDAGTSLRDAVDFLADQTQLNIGIHPKYGELRGKTVELAKTVDVPIETVLHRLLDQVEATYEIRDNLVVIVPRKKK
jgi:hypothetical protein